MSCGCTKAHVTAHLAVVEDSERRKLQEWFPKNPQLRRGGENAFIIAPPHPTLPPLPLRLPPKLSHFQIHIHSNLRHQTLFDSEGWRRRRETPNRRRQAQRKREPKHGVTEWVPSSTGEAELNRLVEAGVLPDRITTRWWPALGEPFPMPNTDDVIVFEDYF